MTDNTATLDRPEQDWEQGEERGRDKRTLVLAAVLAVVLLGGGAYFMLGRGSSSSDSAASTAVTAPVKLHGTAAAPATPLVQPAGTTLPPPAQAPQRNPFKPLYTAPDTSTSTSTTTATSGSPTSTSSTPGAATTTSGGSSTAGGTTTPTAPTTGASYNLKLVSVGGTATNPIMTWTVDSTNSTAIVGQRFGKYGEIIQLGIAPDNSYVTIQVGDAAPQNVKVGETSQVL